MIFDIDHPLISIFSIYLFFKNCILLISSQLINLKFHLDFHLLDISTLYVISSYSLKLTLA